MNGSPMWYYRDIYVYIFFDIYTVYGIIAYTLLSPDENCGYTNHTHYKQITIENKNVKLFLHKYLKAISVGLYTIRAVVDILVEDRS